MSERKPFLLRLPEELHAVLAKWADDDLRSLNAQIEYILRRAANEAGRTRNNEGGHERENEKMEK